MPGIFNFFNNRYARGINTFRFPRANPLNEHISDFVFPLLLFITLQIIYRGFLPETAMLKNAAIEKQKEFLRSQYEVIIKENKISARQAEEQISAFFKTENSDLWVKTAWLAAELIVKICSSLALLCLLNYLVLRRFINLDVPVKKLFAEYGIAYYIFTAETILMILSVPIAGRMLLGINAAEFMQINRISLEGFLLGRINPFLIYFYWHLGCRISYAGGLNKSLSGFMIAGGAGLLMSLILYYILRGTSLIALLY